MKKRIAILRDHNPESSEKWEIACKKKHIDYIVIDLLRNDWWPKLCQFDPDFCVCRPPGDLQVNKARFDEKLFFLEYFTKYKSYPGYHEVFIYENKSALNWFLKINGIPHPETFVSSDKAECIQYLNSAMLPVVAKTLIGAAGSGVRILNTKKEATEYVKKAFSIGLRRRLGPNRKTGTPQLWMHKTIQSPSYFLKKIKEYKARNRDIQKDIVLIQEYISHEYEWRCVKIGESYFAYKKLKVGDKASGSKEFDYGEPPLRLLDFTRVLCERHNFTFMAVDIFDVDGKILVNELQTIFGHKNRYICKVNNKTGRYIYQNNNWIFQEGNYNTNESYDLRLQTILELFEK